MQPFPCSAGSQFVSGTALFVDVVMPHTSISASYFRRIDRD